MYVIAGDAKYAKEFPPVVNYLRNTLNIPDSDSRQEHPETFGRYKYALVTEPHLCRDILMDTTSFFDIILTVGNEKTSGTAANGTWSPFVNLVIPELIRNPLLERKATTTTKHDTTSSHETSQTRKLQKTQREKEQSHKHPTNVIGVISRPYEQSKDLLYWAKAVKVTALAHGSPFATTIFLDSDNIPCHANYGKQIEDVLEKASFQDR
jgi:hypothetical protein